MSGPVGEREIVTLASCKRFKIKCDQAVETRGHETERNYTETALIWLTKTNDQFSIQFFNNFKTFLIFQANGNKPCCLI